jgi:hypothetical protein
MILREPLETAYLREQEQRANDADARADVDQEEMELGMAAHTVQDIIQRYGVEFVESVIQEWKQPQPVTCDQCLHWNNAYQFVALLGKDFSMVQDVDHC